MNLLIYFTQHELVTNVITTVKEKNYCNNNTLHGLKWRKLVNIVGWLSNISYDQLKFIRNYYICVRW